MARSGGGMNSRCAVIALLGCAVGTAAISSVSLGARAQDKPRPTGDVQETEILAKNFAAIGIGAAPATQTLEISGQFGPPVGHALGDFRFWYKSPGAYLVEMNFTGHGETAAGRGSDGHGIFRTSDKAVLAVDGVTIFAVADAWQMLVQPHAVEDYRSVDLVGVEEFNKGWAYVLRLTPKKGESQIGYYDSDTFRLERLELVQRIHDEKDGPDKVYRLQVDYNDYRASETLHVPRLWGITAGRSEIDFRVQSIQLNTPIDDAKFAAAPQ